MAPCYAFGFSIVTPSTYNISLLEEIRRSPPGMYKTLQLMGIPLPSYVVPFAELPEISLQTGFFLA